MATSTDLRVKVSADIADIKQGLALLRGDLAKVREASARTAPDASSWKASLSSIKTQLAGILSIYTAMRAVRWYSEMSDQASNLVGRLKLVTKSQDEFSRAYKGTYDLAQNSQADWQSIVSLFSQLSQTTGESQERILKLTGIIGQAFRVSGASAMETSNGLRQLQQAMAGGVLRAEEFNTIIETGPRIVQALADHFGISFGQVRQYVKDGKITTQEFMAALEESAAKIQSDFDKLPKTVSGAVQQVENALVALVGDTNLVTGASADLARGISDLATTLSSNEVKEGFQTVVSGVVSIGSEMVSWMPKIAEFGRSLSGLIRQAAVDAAAVIDIVRGLSEIQSNVTTGGVAAGSIAGGFRRIQNAKTTREQMMAEAKQQEYFRQVQASYDEFMRNLKRDGVYNGPLLAGMSTGGNSSGTSPAGGGNGGKSAAARAVADSNALLRDSVKRALAELDELYKGNEIGLKQYFAARTEMQQHAIDLEIEQTQMQLAVTTDLGQRRKLEEQITILQRDRADVATKNAREESAANDALVDQLGEIKARLAELDGDSAKAARIRLEAQYLELFKKLESASDEAGTAMVRNLIERLVNKAKVDEIQARMSSVTGPLSTLESSISTQMEAGTLGQLEGERRLQEARQHTLEQLIKLRDAARECLQAIAPGTPEFDAAQAALAQIDANIANVNASMHQFRMQAQDQAVNALSQFFTDLATGAKNFKDAFNAMVLNFIQGLARMAAELLAKRIIMSLFSRFFPMGGGMTQSISASAKGNVFDQSGLRAFARGAAFALPGLMAFASGGAFASGLVSSPTLFTYGGGQLGVMGEAGPEAVMPLTRGSDGKLGVQASGGGGVVVKQPIVAIGDKAVADALRGSYGRDVILTHVRENWGGLTRGGG